MSATAKKKEEAQPPVSLRFGKDDQAMLKVLRERAAASKRSLSEQIKYYAHLGIVAKDNPDLPMHFIEGLLEGIAESKAGLWLLDSRVTSGVAGARTIREAAMCVGAAPSPCPLPLAGERDVQSPPSPSWEGEGRGEGGAPVRE